MLFSLLMIQVVTFIGILVVLRMLFYKHLETALKRLSVSQKQIFQKEEELSKEIDRAKEDRVAQIEEAKKEGKKIVDSAKKEAESLKNSYELSAQRESELLVKKGKDEIDKIKRGISKEIETRAVELSVEMMEHIHSLEGREALGRQFIGEVIKEIQNLDKSKFTVKSNKVRIRTPIALSNDEKKLIKNILAKKMGNAVNIEEKLDASLIVGLILEIDSLVIDGSLRNRLKKVIPYLKKK